MRRAWAILAVAGLVACGDDGDDDGAGEASSTTTTAGEAAATSTTAEATTTTTAPPEALRVLVTNDDGVAAPGIAAIVDGLQAIEGLEVIVVAPAENQSGSGDDVVGGEPAVTETTTANGDPAYAVAGKPADAVLHGLDVLLVDDPPDLVVSGTNEGQNLGPIVDISGTVGAARVAARRGIPALAISQGLAPEGVEPDWEASVEAMVAWLEANLDALVPGSVTNINVPTCAPGTAIRGTVEVPTALDATSGNPVEPADCASTAADPVDDIAGFRAGYVVVSDPGLGS